MPGTKRNMRLMLDVTPIGVLFTTTEVAAILKTAPRTIQRWIKAGQLKGVRIGREYRVKVSDLQAFVEAGSL